MRIDSFAGSRSIRRLDVVAAIVASIATGALLLTPIWVAAGVTGAVIVALLVLRSPIIGLALTVLLLPFGLVAARIGGVSGVSPAELVLILTIAVLTVRAVADRARPLVVPMIAIGPSILIAVMLSSASQAASTDLAAKEVARWLEIVVALIVARSILDRGRPLRTLLIVQSLVISIEVALGLYQFVFQVGPPSFVIGSFLRAYGTFGQPNPYAGYLVVAGLPLAFWSAGQIGRWISGSAKPTMSELFVVCASGAAGIGLVLSMSRGAWLGVAVGTGIAIIVLQRRFGNVVRLGLGVGGVVGLTAALGLIPEYLSQRLQPALAYFRWFDPADVVPTAQNWSIVERMAHWDAARRMFLDSPFLGLGPGSYVIEYEHYAILPWWTDPLGHAHNMYLHMLAETGLIGLFFYSATVVSWITLCVLAVRSDPTDRWIFLKAGVLATVVAVSVHSVFDNLYVQGLNIQLAIWLGVAATLYPAKNSEGRNRTHSVPRLKAGLEH